MPGRASLHEAEELAVATGPKSPSSSPDTPLPACPLVFAQGQSPVRPCGTAPVLEARFLEQSLVPRGPLFFPGVPSPNIQLPCDLGFLLRAPP